MPSQASPSLAKSLRKSARQSKPKIPVWKGPEVDGITQSIIGLYLGCRQRCRLRVVEGLCPKPSFQHRPEYGNMWHLCKEVHGKGNDWVKALNKYANKLNNLYPGSREDILKWTLVCHTQFSTWLDLKAKGPKTRRQPLWQEEVFEVPYDLPSGRTVILKGKWDGVELEGPRKKPFVWLTEDKTKGEVDLDQITRQLKFDLQTMTYLVALREYLETDYHDQVGSGNPTIKGITYNVTRRPLSGGVGSIRPHKATSKKPAETQGHFYGRLGDIIRGNPDHFFMTLDAEVTAHEIKAFEEEFLQPCLEEICWWWDSLTGTATDYAPPNCHYRTPYGIWNPLAEGRSTNLDAYLETGSTLGLVWGEPLFKELA